MSSDVPALSLAQAVENSLRNGLQDHSTVEPRLLEQRTKANIVVCLEDDHHMSLHTPSKEFEALKSLLLRNKTVIWVTRGKYEAYRSSLKAFAIPP